MSKPIRNLAELRTEIDAVDQQLLALLNQRASLANEVGELKRAEGSPVFRPEREAQVINGLQAANPGPLKAGNVATIWREIMSACRALEAPQRVAYLGPAGTFSEEAALGFFGSSIVRVPCANFDEVFTVYVSGAGDATDLVNERKAYTATRLLFDAWYRAAFLWAGLRMSFISTSWMVDRVTARYATTLVFVGAMDAMIPDLPLTATEWRTRVLLTGEMLDHSEESEINPFVVRMSGDQAGNNVATSGDQAGHSEEMNRG